jgi:hypothetical protein
MERASCLDGNQIAGRAYLAPITTARISSMSSSTTESRTELDSHADTSVVCEDTALIIADFERPVTVFGYDEDPSKSSVCKTVSAVVVERISAKWTIAVLHTMPQECQPDDNLFDALKINVNLSGPDTSRRDVCKVKTGNRKPTVGVELLAKRWGISLSRARRTIEATAQQVIRTVLHAQVQDER